VANATHGEGVRRGVGYAVAMKNIGFSEGFDDYSTARVRLSVEGGEPLVEVHTAAPRSARASSRAGQIARTELGVERVAVLDADTAVGSAGSTRLAPDLRDRRGGQGGVRGGARAVGGAGRERGVAVEGGAAAPDALALATLDEGEAIEETVQWRIARRSGSTQTGRATRTCSTPSRLTARWSTTEAEALA